MSINPYTVTTKRYAWFCDDCGNSHTSLDLFFNAACEKCGSVDITKAETYSPIEYDDEACEERMEEIRAAFDYIGEYEPNVIELPSYSEGFLRRRQA